MLNQKNALIVLIIIFICLAAPRLVNYDLDHGDEYADSNVLIAGKNFAKHGFTNLRFLPLFKPYSNEPHKLYTHFPPLPENINGWLRVIFKTNSLIFFRFVAILFSLGGLIFWFFFIRRITSSDLAAFLAGLFYLINPAFLYGIDGLHQTAYSEFLRQLSLFLFAVFLVGETPPLQNKKLKLIFVGLWLAYFLNSLITFEYIIYTFLFFILFSRLFAKAPLRRIKTKELFILLTAPIAAFGLHLAQNAWYFGSLSLALRDFADIILKRSLGSYDMAGSFSWLAWFKYVIVQYFSIAFLFNFVFLFIVAYLCFLLYQKIIPAKREEIRKLYRLLAITIICGISWYVILPSNALSHAFVYFLLRHILLAAALVFTIISLIVKYSIESKQKYPLLAKTGFLLLVVIIASTGIFNSQLPVTKAKVIQAQDFRIFKKCLIVLKNMSKIQDVVGVNYHRYPFMSYYTNRNFKVFYDPKNLETASQLPEYFIFIPYQNQQAKAIVEFLDEKYTPLFQCNSRRFPAAFMKLKSE